VYVRPGFGYGSKIEIGRFLRLAALLWGANYTTRGVIWMPAIIILERVALILADSPALRWPFRAAVRCSARLQALPRASNLVLQEVLDLVISLQELA
jgi:hypothetical protein